MDENKSAHLPLEPGEALIVIGRDLKARLIVPQEEGETEPESMAVLWAKALTMALNDEDETLIQELVDRLMEGVDPADDDE